MTTMTTAINTLRKHSESIDSRDAVQVPEMSIGDALAQGDVAIELIAKIPHGAVEVPWRHGDFQLAPGNTQGSRHTIPAKYRKTTKIFRVSDGDALSDLVIHSKAPFDVEHPEHADHIGYPTGCYRVHHEQNEQLQRVLD